ncbi:hypothetical protein ACFZCT_21305 [Streptomyces qaidamensis]|uniref:hypothetical protein n=1 Tax=Streptomyces qaidamensis TaxID=1783515 RepID=UPI0036E62182
MPLNDSTSPRTVRENRAVRGAVGGVAVAVAVVVAKHAMEQNFTEDAEDTGPAAGSVEEDQRLDPHQAHRGPAQEEAR